MYWRRRCTGACSGGRSNHIATLRSSKLAAFATRRRSGRRSSRCHGRRRFPGPNAAAARAYAHGSFDIPQQRAHRNGECHARLSFLISRKRTCGPCRGVAEQNPPPPHFPWFRSTKSPSRRPNVPQPAGYVGPQAKATGPAPKLRNRPDSRPAQSRNISCLSAGARHYGCAGSS